MKIMRARPFLPVAIGMIGGIVAARYGQLSMAHGLVVFGVSVSLLAVRVLRAPCGLLACAGLAAALYAYRYEIRDPHDLRLLLDGQNVLARVRGQLAETPSVKDFQAVRTNEVAYGYANIRVEQVEIAKEWRPASGVVATVTRGELSDGFFKGRSVEIDGVIAAPPGAAAPGLFDFRHHLFNERIFFQVKADSTNDWRLLSAEGKPLTDRFRAWAKDQLQRGLNRQDEPLELLWAMTLGWKRALTGEVSEPFLRTGTMHIFAVSGLHVACIAVVLVALARLAGASWSSSGLIAVPLIWFYCLATGWESSSIRSALMFTVIVAGRCLARPSDLLNSIAGAAVIILLIEPEQVFQAGFQLSFAVVTALAIYAVELTRLIAGWFGTDPFLPESLRPGWRQALDGPIRYLSSALAVSIASWLGSFLIVACYFNLITPVSLAANLVAVPLSSVALATSLGSLLCPPLGPLLNPVSWVFMHLTVQFTKWCARWPGGFFFVSKPSLLDFLLGLAVLAAIAWALRPAERRWKRAVVAAALCGVWLATAALTPPHWRLTVLPAGGAPVYADFPKDELLVDCSNEREADHLVTRFLRAQGIDRLPYLLLTHGDQQHVGGFNQILTEFSPRRIFVGPASSRSPAYRAVLKQLGEAPEKRQVVAAGETVSGWTVLHPARGTNFSRADDNSLVLRRSVRGWTVLLLADLGEPGQRELMRRQADLRADIVVTGLPEQGEPLLPELLGRIEPKVIVLGTARYPYRAMGNARLRQRLESSAELLLSTLEDGAVQVDFEGGQARIRAMSGRELILSRKGRSRAILNDSH